MPVQVTTAPAKSAPEKTVKAVTAAAPPAKPATLSLVLRATERYDFERQLYVRNVVYTFSYDKAVQMLRLKDDQERPYFVRHIPGQNHRKIMVEVPAHVDMTKKQVTTPLVSDAPPQTPPKIIEVGSEEELADLHLSAAIDDDVAAGGDEGGTIGDEGGVEV